jgi:hypothetical protein
MKAIAADIPPRYQRASDLLDAVLAARTPAPSTIKRPWKPAPVTATGPAEDVQEIKERLKAREAVQARFCWKCGKALPARAEVCPFCSEKQ